MQYSVEVGTLGFVSVVKVEVLVRAVGFVDGKDREVDRRGLEGRRGEGRGGEARGGVRRGGNEMRGEGWGREGRGGIG